jgi:hypothetical protein
MDPYISQPMVRKLMIQFADGTGISSPKKKPRRYLWTDAFALCNFLELYVQTGEAKYLQLAMSLVDQVHTVLGRHRSDDSRTGWISGLDEPEGKKYPTKGGLRIGKGLGERSNSDSYDEQLEWDRDGQYFHYLTKWMHALDRVSRVTHDLKFNQWAIELAQTAHAHFVYDPGSGNRKRMYWKMSIDLSYPLVPSMGQHDPLDGFITYHQLRSTALKGTEIPSALDLSAEIAEMAAICVGKSWVTDDPLGIGGLLIDAWRMTQLIVSGNFESLELLELILESSLPGLKSFVQQKSILLTADSRLAFREFGLSIGLSAMCKLAQSVADNPDLFSKAPKLPKQIDSLMRYTPLIEGIETFWLKYSNQQSKTWTSHQDINQVMLATSLAPEGFLTL